MGLHGFYNNCHSSLLLYKDQIDFLTTLKKGKELEQYLYNLLCEHHTPNYHATVDRISNNLFRFIHNNQSHYNTVKIKPEDVANKTKFDARTSEEHIIQYVKNHTDTRAYQIFVKTKKAPIADRHIVLQTEINSSSKVVQKLISLMSYQQEKAVENPFEISHFEILLNSDTALQTLAKNKVVIYYKKGIEPLSGNFFDANGQHIIDEIRPLIAVDQKVNFFPFYYTLENTNGAAWGDKSPNHAYSFSSIRVKALANMLLKMGHFPENLEVFTQQLRQNFVQYGIQGDAPYLNIGEA